MREKNRGKEKKAINGDKKRSKYGNNRQNRTIERCKNRKRTKEKP